MDQNGQHYPILRALTFLYCEIVYTKGVLREYFGEDDRENEGSEMKRRELVRAKISRRIRSGGREKEKDLDGESKRIWGQLGLKNKGMMFGSSWAGIVEGKGRLMAKFWRWKNGEIGPTEGCKENPKVHKVFLRQKKRKVVATPDVEEQPQKKRVKKPSQWVNSPYTTKGQWIKHVDATTIDLFRDVDTVKDKEFSKWYNQS
ncbi:hypothetical protein Fot_05065 [Forsythia ovata]|uniref:Uncharacterized protein n=1 Tax=Forsythia ovata TaxID=205694 RepID=A0ABD1WP22_9LAMI